MLNPRLSALLSPTLVALLLEEPGACELSAGDSNPRAAVVIKWHCHYLSPLLSGQPIITLSPVGEEEAELPPARLPSGCWVEMQGKSDKGGHLPRDSLDDRESLLESWGGQVVCLALAKSRPLLGVPPMKGAQSGPTPSPPTLHSRLPFSGVKCKLIYRWQSPTC